MHEVFTYRSFVHFDELDPMQLLHNSRYAVHVERATSAFFGSFGRKWEADVQRNTDQFHAVREFHIEFLSPFDRPGELVVELWVERLGITSVTYGFRIVHGAAQRVVAEGRRAVVKLDPTTFQPTPWTDEFLDAHTALEVRRMREPARAVPAAA
jgi:acyl-CoA thioester hydrolase